VDGGSAEAIIDAAINEALADLDDRGDDDKPRRVLIELTLARMKNGLVEASIKAQSKLPPRQTASTIGNLAKRKDRAVLMFQELSPEDPDQPSFGELTGDPDGAGNESDDTE
jgi:hypothetical protein